MMALTPGEPVENQPICINLSASCPRRASLFAELRFDGVAISGELCSMQFGQCAKAFVPLLLILIETLSPTHEPPCSTAANVRPVL